jgi:protein phosphatase
MVRIAETAAASDTGRQRSANEDSYYESAPLFAVADGMGGAQAGEVASRIAVESFDPSERGEEAPEAFLRSIAERANERIHRLAQADASRSGMGTTLTAALVEGDEISLAHVGDSRAYLLRGGKLRQLTSDHSLVEELRRQGRLTEEQAADHPQRSIITRALGPEADVEVDTMTYRARPDDVFLLCSDGLTTMVKDDLIERVLRDAPNLDEGVRQLVAAANEAGGRDNITAIAFRLEGADEEAVPDGATLVGPTAEEAGLAAASVRAETAATRPRVGGAAAEPARPRRRRRVPVRAVVVVLIAAFLAAAGVYGARQVWFLGGDSGGRLALYRGLPYDLPFGIHLYTEEYAAPVQVQAIPRNRRPSATDHTLRTHDDAVSLLEDLQNAASPPPPAHGHDGPASKQIDGGSGNVHGRGSKSGHSGRSSG